MTATYHIKYNVGDHEDMYRLHYRLPLSKDSRVLELLRALNEQILPRDTVFAKVCSIAGVPVRFYQYRDGSYYICE
ncbi:hypothetical protein JXQ70_11910 [bacterium]|nr:hypothetical protein [bacterium]